MNLNTTIADNLTVVTNSTVLHNSKWDKIMKSISYTPPIYFPGNRTLIDDKTGSVYQLDILISKAVLIPKKSTESNFSSHYNEVISILSQSITGLNCEPEVSNGMQFRMYTYVPVFFTGVVRYSTKNSSVTKTVFGHSLSEKSDEYIFDFRYNSKYELIEPIIPVQSTSSLWWGSLPPTHPPYFSGKSSYHA
ncbi:MAG: hypothetical protein PHG66_01975 [Candidatus Colwellbacteria bacterium]|nr:hypothetical protein [Candidatus Colwellbacteria bacterium]